MSSTYEDALRTAKADLIAAIQQRDNWNLEIGRLSQLVKSLAAAAGVPVGETDHPVASSVGFTDVVLAVVNRSSKALSAQQVKETLAMFDYDLNGYSNPLAHIHQTLKRLSAQSKIIDLGNGSYKRAALYEALLNAGTEDFRPKLGYHKLPGKR